MIIDRRSSGGSEAARADGSTGFSVIGTASRLSHE
jgi:hypothetical protein